MKRALLSLLPIFSLLLVSGCADNQLEIATQQLQALLQKYDSELVPMRLAYNRESFWAASTGNPQAYDKAAKLKMQQAQFFTQAADFRTISQLYKNPVFQTPLQRRQVHLLYHEYLQYQMPPQLAQQTYALEKSIYQRTANFRIAYQDQELSKADIRQRMSQSKSSQELQAIWLASKKLGELNADDLLQLVKIRNQAAQQLGFVNFFEMQLAINELQPDYLQELFDELDVLTRGPYAQIKADIDRALAQRYSIAEAQLQPWHYQDLYFQYPPKLDDEDFDSYYSQHDVLQLAQRFFEGLGLGVDAILEQSDFRTAPQKSQFNIVRQFDYKGDVRISFNLQNDAHTMHQCLYEMSYALYLKHLSPHLSPLMHKPAQLFTLDAVAMLLANQATNPAWLATFTPLDSAQRQHIQQHHLYQQRLQRFVFARWVQVVYRFERSLYEHPEQDLNALWWELVESYQMLRKPDGRNAPDWATKEHLIVQPATYHNYMLGELLASQLQNHLEAATSDSLPFFRNPNAGEYLRSTLFAPGASLSWHELLYRATGEELNPEYFYKSLVY